VTLSKIPARRVGDIQAAPGARLPVLGLIVLILFCGPFFFRQIEKTLAEVG
jgi:hypothetical protein